MPPVSVGYRCSIEDTLTSLAQFTTDFFNINDDHIGVASMSRVFEVLGNLKTDILTVCVSLVFRTKPLRFCQQVLITHIVCRLSFARNAKSIQSRTPAKGSFKCSFEEIPFDRDLRWELRSINNPD